MGIQFWIADKANRREFWLGKGEWSDLLPELQKAPIEPVSIEELDRRLRAAWLSSWLDPYEPDKALALWAFCQVAGWNVELRRDTQDYDDEWILATATVTGTDATGAPLTEMVKCWKSTVKCVASLDPHDNDKLEDDPLAEQQAHWAAVAQKTVVGSPL